MSTRTGSSPVVRDHPGSLASRVTAAALLGALGCAGYISTLFLLSDHSIREAARSPLTIVSNLIVAAAFAVLAVSLPGLRQTVGVPGWVLTTTALGCVGVAATSFGTGTLGVHAAGLLTEAQMDEISVWFDLFQGPQVLPCMIGFVAFAVIGWRRRSIPRGAAALFGLAGVLSVVPAYPPGALIGALALGWAVRSSGSPRGADIQPASVAAR